MISPAVEELSMTHPHVVFLKVDVDQSPVCPSSPVLIFDVGHNVSLYQGYQWRL